MESNILARQKRRRADSEELDPFSPEKTLIDQFITFKQFSESDPAKYILIHLPEKEIFMSTLHPAASLYEDVTSYKAVKKVMKILNKILSEMNIGLITVRGALELDPENLRELVSEFLIYEIDNSSKIDTNSEYYKEFERYVSDKYKKEVINKLTTDQLIDVMLTSPKYKLRPTEINTFIEPTLISFKPLGNLIFCRDQQITTAKGIIIGRTRSSQRAGEHKIMKKVFENLKSNLIGQVTEKYDKNAYLEGGDYFVARKDLSMLGVGLRTSIKGAEYLMENDLLGTRYLAIIYDNEDLDQQRIHLDTYFNFINEKYVLVLDFDEVQTHYQNKKIGRKVYLFDNDAEAKEIESDDANVPVKSGKYKLVKTYEKFYSFLEENNYKMIKVTHQQQIEHMINFLNVGNNTVISQNKDLVDVVKETGVKVIYIDFKPVLNMHGAMHSITQVSRV